MPRLFSSPSLGPRHFRTISVLPPNGPEYARLHSKRFENERLLLEHGKDLVDVFVRQSSRHEVINKAFLELLLSLVSISRPHGGIESAFAAKLSASVYII